MSTIAGGPQDSRHRPEKMKELGDLCEMTWKEARSSANPWYEEFSGEAVEGGELIEMFLDEVSEKPLQRPGYLEDLKRDVEDFLEVLGSFPADGDSEKREKLLVGLRANLKEILERVNMILEDCELPPPDSGLRGSLKELMYAGRPAVDADPVSVSSWEFKVILRMNRCLEVWSMHWKTLAGEA
ncbi:uncharacterized protein LOC100898932 [Galendromus occidentalis]|uniref:Uncharacterized protein LOC100898932 n=1 Tax=Galendromus occidentalis TaxID=34638 RepID=A0AAJ6QSG4_9ACAR|nr:uncharacterized protein LOC100898932 [Galendromus occidentalis]